MSPKQSKATTKNKSSKKSKQGLSKKSKSTKSAPLMETVDMESALILARATRPLLSLFATCTDVFEEEEALSAENRKVTLGRIYREWKNTMLTFEPNYDFEIMRHPRKAIKKGLTKPT